QLGSIVTKECCDLHRIESPVRLSPPRSPYRRFLHILRRSQHLLRAEPQAVDLARFGWTPFIVVEGCIYPAQHSFQRNSGVLPGFNQGPIERGEHENTPAPPLEVLFDFGEVVEVILQSWLGGHFMRVY